MANIIKQVLAYFTQSGPVSPKVMSGAISGFIFFAASWVTTTWIDPSGIPVSFKPVLAGLSTILGGLVGSWLAKHRVTAAEVERAIADAQRVMSSVHPAQVTFRDKPS